MAILHRRDFLAGCATASAAVLASELAACQQTGSAMVSNRNEPMMSSELAAAAREAWLYGLMPIENAQARSRVLGRTPANTLFHARKPMTVKTQIVTATNTDTLYSRAWLDLSKGPVRLGIPETGSRYASYAMMDMYGTNFAILGTRTTGGRAQTVTIIGPDAATPDPLAIRSPTRWMWLQIRMLIENEADAPAVNALQDAIRLDAPAAEAPRPRAGRDADWDQYFSDLQALLIENPPPATDLGFFDRIAPLGLGPTGGFDPARFSDAQVSEIKAGITAGRAHILGARSGLAANGWLYPKTDLGDFKQDYLYRAEIAVEGLAALPVVEASYLRPFTEEGHIYLPPGKSWLLRLGPDELPPVDGFWSLTAYRRTPDGQFMLIDNEIDRYAIRDRTPGLVYGPDGSLEIVISPRRPSNPANWLPAPADAPLGMLFRAYLPREELIDGRYRLPALRAL